MRLTQTASRAMTWNSSHQPPSLAPGILGQVLALHAQFQIHWPFGREAWYELPGVFLAPLPCLVLSPASPSPSGFSVLTDMEDEGFLGFQESVHAPSSSCSILKPTEAFLQPLTLPITLGAQGAGQAYCPGRWDCQANLMLFHGGMSPRDDVSNGIGGKQKRDGWLNPFQWKSSKVTTKREW